MKSKVFGDIASLILYSGAKKVTKFLSERYVVKGTRRGKVDRRYRSTTILFTVGAPNYAERKCIKEFKRSGEPFPVKKLRIKWEKR